MAYSLFNLLWNLTHVEQISHTQNEKQELENHLKHSFATLWQQGTFAVCFMVHVFHPCKDKNMIETLSFSTSKVRKCRQGVTLDCGFNMETINPNISKNFFFYYNIQDRNFKDKKLLMLPNEIL